MSNITTALISIGASDEASVSMRAIQEGLIEVLMQLHGSKAKAWTLRKLVFTALRQLVKRHAEAAVQGIMAADVKHRDDMSVADWEAWWDDVQTQVGLKG